MAQAVAVVEAEELQAFVDATATPLDDRFWREHENQSLWCCPSCDYNHPLVIQAAAREEIDDYLKRGEP